MYLSTLLNNTIRNSKAQGWLKIGLITGGTQIILQLIGLVLGIFIVRQLSKGEYALYTMANTLMGAIILLSDSGVTSGVMAEGGKVWQDKVKLGAVLETGLAMRKKFGFVFGITGIPILFYLLVTNGSSITNAIFIVIGVIVSFYASLSDALLEIVPKLHQEIAPLQRNALVVNFLRLLISLILLFFLPYAFIAVIVSGVTRIIGNIKLRKITNKLTEPSISSDEAVKKRIYSIVKRAMPGAIYYCIAGQINIWLMSIFGNESGIADVGALGRLVVVLGILSNIFNVVYVPRFARAPNYRKPIFKNFITVTILAIALLAIFILTCYIFSDEALWLLGSKYSQLKTEFLLNIFGNCIGILGGSIYTLTSSKGWIMNPVFSIGLNIGSLIIAVSLFSASSVRGVMFINIFTSSVSFFTVFLFGIIKIWKLKAQ